MKYRFQKEALSNVLVLRVRSTEPEPALVSARRVDLLVETPCGLRLASRLAQLDQVSVCLLYTSPSPRDKRQSRMPSSA